jgi:hypothetical protein
MKIDGHLNKFPLPVVSALHGWVLGISLRPQVLQLRVAAQARSVSERTDGSGELDGVSCQGRRSPELVPRVSSDALNELAAAEGNIGHSAVVNGHVRHVLCDINRFEFLCLSFIYITKVANA